MKQEQSMELNKIKLLNKEELLEKLKQNGFEEVSAVLQDKDINGETFIELEEYQIFKWKPTSYQKRILLDCLQKVKAEPTILIPKEVHKFQRSLLKGETRNKLEQSLKRFGEVENISKLPETRFNPDENRGIIDAANNSLKKKPVPIPITLSPSSSDGNIHTVKNRHAQIIPPPVPFFPKEPLYEEYLEMHAPTQSKKDNDYYITPIDLADSKHLISNRPSNIKQSTTKSQFDKHYSPNKTYENLKLNVGYKGGPSGKKIDLNTALQRKPDQNEDKSELQQSPNDIFEDKRPYKLMDDENMAQSGSIFSPIQSLASKFNVFKGKTRGNETQLYENHFIEGARFNNPTGGLRNRPLPEIPAPATSASRNILYPPENIGLAESELPDNYVELINYAPDAKTNPKKPETLLNEPEIYENTSLPLNTNLVQGRKTDIRFSSPSTAKTVQRVELGVGNIKEQFTTQISDQEPHRNRDLLATLLSQQLKERLKLNNDFEASNIDDSDFDSEFDEDNEDVSYGNISSDIPVRGLIQEVPPACLKNSSSVARNKTESPAPNKKLPNPRAETGALRSRGRLVLQNETETSFESEEAAVYDNIADYTRNSSVLKPLIDAPVDRTLVPKNEIQFKPPVPNKNLNNLIKRDRSGAKPGSLNNNELHATQRQQFGKEKIPFSDGNQIPNNSKDISRPPATFRLDKDTKERSTVENAIDQHPEKIPSFNEVLTQKLKQCIGKSQVSNIENIGHTGQALNFENEPFYKNVSRKGAKLFLSNLEDGAFLVRPSSKYFLSLTVKSKNNNHDFGIKRNANNTLTLHTAGDTDAPEFSSLRDFISYFTREPLTFLHKGELTEIYLKQNWWCN